MKEYRYIILKEEPMIKDRAAEWFHSKWGVPKDAYLECMNAYLNEETEYGWYLCLDGKKIIAGMGVIENDFHDREFVKYGGGRYEGQRNSTHLFGDGPYRFL